MKKFLCLVIATFLIMTAFPACKNGDTLLDPSNPVTLTMWHVYGEQVDSPMKKYIQEFNNTEGKAKGVVVNVTLLSNAIEIGEKLLAAQADKPGYPKMPDLFFCHSNNAVQLGTENLVDWRSQFTEAELSDYKEGFISDGVLDDILCVFPVSKSTHMLFLAGGVFDRFSNESGVTKESLSTWSGFFDAAEKYYNLYGKPFCAIDYLLRCVELNAISKNPADVDFYTEEGWYDLSCESFRSSYMEFADAYSKGHIVVSDLYSNTQIMTGETAAGISSSASVLYFNDTISYPNCDSEPTNLIVLPLPQPENASARYATQTGVGLCAYKTTDKKAEASAVFAKWFTESERNLEFVASTGYMPVRKDAFDKISNYYFEKQSFRNLYDALRTTGLNCTFVAEPSFAYYYEKTYSLYDELRSLQKLTPRTPEYSSSIAQRAWELVGEVA